MTDRYVLKIGGSLLRNSLTPVRLRELIEQQYADHQINLVIGGGRVLDALRELDQIHQLDPIVMHWRCIRALDVTFSVLCEWFPNAIAIDTQEKFETHLDLRSPGLFCVSVQSFYRPQTAATAPLNWTTTTDTLSAILARQLQADRLVLLKSCPASTGTSIVAASRGGLVDEAFPAQCSGLTIDWVNLHETFSATRLVLP